MGVLGVTSALAGSALKSADSTKVLQLDGLEAEADIEPKETGRLGMSRRLAFVVTGILRAAHEGRRHR